MLCALQREKQLTKTRTSPSQRCLPSHLLLLRCLLPGLAVTKIKRSARSFYSPARFKQESNDRGRAVTFVHETHTFMHHVGSTLGLMRFAMSACKRGKVRQIFHFHKNCKAHTKVYILRLKTITHHQGPLCACALLLTKAGGAFITGKPRLGWWWGGGGVTFPAATTWAYSAMNSNISMTVICGSSWFMIALRSNLHLFHP